MTDYLINQNHGGEHYFYRPYEGICVKRRTSGGFWQEHSQVIPKGRNPFCVYQAQDMNMHVICVDAEGRLVYAVRRDNEWKKYTLSRFQEDVTLTNIQLCPVRGRLNLLYSALYNGENLLVHCILGNHAKPTTVSHLADPHFFIFKNKVYYTNQSGTLGFTDFSDEKPIYFSKLHDDAKNVSICEHAGKEMLIFTHNSRLFINGKDVLYDERIENPILVKGADRIYVMWKSGGFIRYISSFNGGTTWSEPMRFINSNSAVRLYTYQSGNTFCHYYGYESNGNITLLGVSDVFKKDVNFQETELKKIQNQLSQKTMEAENAKKEVERLNRILSGLLP